MDLEKELLKRPDKARTLELATYICADPARFGQLIECVLSDDDTISKYGSWLISHCMEQDRSIVQPHLDALIGNLGKVPPPNESVIRSTVKALAEAGDFSEELQGIALQHCFDYLLDPKTPVAIQVHAMQTVFHISKNEPDLLRELRTVIEDNLPHGSAAYKARGKRVLVEIGRLIK